MERKMLGFYYLSQRVSVEVRLRKRKISETKCSQDNLKRKAG